MNRPLIWTVLAAGFAVWGVSYTAYHVGLVAERAAAGHPRRRIGPGVRLHQRHPRRGQLHRHGRFHARPHAAPGRTLGRLFQFRRRLRVRRTRGDDHWNGRRTPVTLFDTLMILSGLSAAILWNLMTCARDYPPASSHWLIGGLTGAAIAKAGFGSVILSGLLKIAAFIVLSPLIGGWRIVKTMGSKITKLDPFGGFCAESGAAATLFATAAAGIPVSTTHTIAGSIVGFGAMRRLSAVRWGVTHRHCLGLAPDHSRLCLHWCAGVFRRVGPGLGVFVVYQPNQLQGCDAPAFLPDLLLLAHAARPCPGGFSPPSRLGSCGPIVRGGEKPFEGLLSCRARSAMP